MFTIGLSTCGKEFTETLFQAYRDAWIPAMEISTAAENCKNLDYSQIAAWAQQYGLTVRAYTPVLSPSPFPF